MADDNNGIKNLKSITLWLTPEFIQRLDRVVEEQSRGAAKASRSSLIRLWLEKGVLASEKRRG